MSESQHPSENLDSGSAQAPVDCAAALALVPAYALGAADADEIALVEVALTFCPQVAEALAQYRLTAESLLYTPPPMTPAPELRRRVLQAIAADVAARQPRSLRLHARPIVAWLAAAAAVVVLLISNLLWFVRVEELERRNDILTNWSGQKDELLIALSSSASERIDLVSTDESQAQYASVLYSPSANYAVLVTDSLPSLPPDRTYQLWLLRGDERLSAGVFTIETDGRGALVFRIRDPLTTYTGLGISVEPAGGSPAPTTPPVATVRL